MKRVGRVQNCNKSVEVFYDEMCCKTDDAVFGESCTALAANPLLADLSKLHGQACGHFYSSVPGKSSRAHVSQGSNGDDLGSFTFIFECPCKATVIQLEEYHDNPVDLLVTERRTLSRLFLQRISFMNQYFEAK